MRFLKLTIALVAICCLLAGCHDAQTNRQANQNPPFTQDSDSVVVAIGADWLRLQVCGERIIRVRYSSDANSSPASLIVLPQKPVKFTCEKSSDHELMLSTAALSARVNLLNGAVRFLDRGGHVILAEADRTLWPDVVQGEQTFHVQQRWKSAEGESLYGLGENQLGLTDIKGFDLDLWQHNGTIIIPFLLSNRGYGILWDNPSYSRFGDLRPWEPMHAENLTATYFSDENFSNPISRRSEDEINIDLRPQVNGVPTSAPSNPFTGVRRADGSVRWEGNFVADRTGPHLFRTFSNGGIKVWIDGKLVIDHWRQGWLPWLDIAKISMEAGRRYPLKVEWTIQQGTVVQMFCKPPAAAPAADDSTSLWSQVGDGIDYYFVYGNNPDDVIAGYRQLTGPVPMMPIWAFGLWQSRQRYETSQQSLDVIQGFRSRQIPFDNIVQDWFYWPEDAWGSHEFDRQRFPDPQGWIDAIHTAHAHVMISVWGKFYTGTKNFDAMKASGFLYPENLAEGVRDWLGYPYTFFDAFNPAARDLFWAQVKPALFDKGIDAWWLDATEPDLLPTPTLQGQISHVNPTALGPGSKVLNAYSIMMGKTFYDNQRAASPDQRVFILTRSGFASQQRYAESSWSGDTSSTWTAMKKQIAAGLSFCASGVPYWTMDVGGFSVPWRFSARSPNPDDVEEWRELCTRWFEFGAFCPLLRVHGEFPHREMWEFGGDDSPAYRAQLKFDRLRYRLLPYVYSLAGDVTQHGGTMMRPLVMDFADDSTAREIADQYLFGPVFLVCPVTEFKARSRSVYLPARSDWYDFWTGQKISGGQSIDAPAPLDAMPLFVRAGSIIPMGPELQYTTEKPADPITLLVYTGADGHFRLYEDDGVSYQYERGNYSTIEFDWNQASRTLTIGRQQGGYAGMPNRRTFNIVIVAPEHPIPFSFDPQSARSVEYDGDAARLRF